MFPFPRRLLFLAVFAAWAIPSNLPAQTPHPGWNAVLGTAFEPDSVLGTDDQWSDAFVGPGARGPIGDLNENEVTFSGELFGKLHIAGRMAFMDGDPVGDIAVWAGDHWMSPYPDFPGTPSRLFEFNESLWGFDTDEESGTAHLYTLNNNVWEAVEFPSFPEGAAIVAVCVYEGDLFVTGILGNYASGFMVRWDGLTWTDCSEGLGLDDAFRYARTFQVHKGKLYVGGSFFPEPSPGGCLASWNGERWEIVGGGTSSTVLDLLSWGNQLVVAGYFWEAGEDPIPGLALWDGESWSALPDEGTLLASSVNQVVLGPDDALYAFGRFSSPEDEFPRYTLGRWTGRAWNDEFETFSTYPFNAGVAVADGRIYVTGEFNIPFTGFLVFARDGSTWDFLKDRWPVWLGYYRGALLAVPNGVYAAGEFYVRERPNPQTGVAFWNGRVWSMVGDPMNHSPRALALFHGDLIVGGKFTSIGDISTPYVARFDGSRWVSLDQGLDNDVYALAVYGNDLIAGGRFLHSDRGAPMNLVARWDGRKWTSLGEGVRGAGGFVSDMDVYRDKLVVSGRFNFSGHSVRSDNIAQWNGAEWAPLEELRVSGGDFIREVAVANQILYASCGYGFVSQGDSLGNVAGWNGTAWHGLYVKDTGGSWLRLGSHEDRLVLGGPLETLGGEVIGNLVEWDGERWLSLGTGIDWGAEGGLPASAIDGVTSWGSDLYLSGSFFVAGGKISGRIAHWHGESNTAAPEPQHLLAYPNPSAARVTLSFTDLAPGPFSLKIYDIQGRLVRELENGPIHTTAATYLWDLVDQNGNAVVPGVYFARARSGSGTSTRKLMVIQ